MQPPKWTQDGELFSQSEAAQESDAPQQAGARNVHIHRVDVPHELQQAGPQDMIALLPAPGNVPLVFPKATLEIVTVSIYHGMYILLHGETGTGKTALIEALMLVPENWQALCRMAGLPPRPLTVFPVEMVNFETAGEVYKQRAIRDGQTFDELSEITSAIHQTPNLLECGHIVAIWTRELGRVHSASVQGGLLNLMTHGMICLPNGETVSGLDITWIADSNYHTSETATHTLVTQDDALARRLSVSIPFQHLSPEENVRIIDFLTAADRLPRLDDDIVVKMVELGQAIHEQRGQGNLLTLAPPTLYGYFTFMRLANALPHLSIQEIANVTLLGAGTPTDREQGLGLFSEVFGVRIHEAEKSIVGGDLF